MVPDTLNLAVRPSDDPRTRSSQQHHPLQSNVIDCIEAVDRYTLSCSSVYFLVFLLHFLFVPCVGLSWLSVSFLLHVKYTVSYRIVSIASLNFKLHGRVYSESSTTIPLQPFHALLQQLQTSENKVNQKQHFASYHRGEVVMFALISNAHSFSIGTRKAVHYKRLISIRNITQYSQNTRGKSHSVSTEDIHVA